MKKQYILSAVVAAASLAFASCDKEEMYMEPQQPEQNGNGGFIINPEDTAGIVVPEGYGLVVFPGNRSQTRASLDPITGKSDRISSLRILIYKKDENGTFKYVNDEKVSVPNSATWPLSKSPTTVQEYGTYRAVFVGNMDATLFGNEEVLTGVGEGYSYEDARIKLPSIERFNDTNLFHWFSSDEFEVNENPTVVPVTLQRIVTRSSFATYGIQEGINVSGTDYPSKFYASLLEPEHGLGFYKQVFGKPFENSLREMLIRDIVFPLAYVYSQQEGKKLDQSTEVGQWYNEISQNMDGYLETYLLDKNEWGYTEDVYSSMEDLKSGLEQLCKNFSNNKYIDQIPDYINAIFTGTNLSDFAANIREENTLNVDDYVGGASKPSFTEAKNATIAALKQNQQGNDAIFPVWANAQNATVELSGNYPSAIDFDLNVKEYAPISQATIGLTKPQNPNGNEDNSLNIYLLGENKEETTYQFGLTSLTVSDRAYTLDGITGQSLRPNTWMHYRLVPENITLGDACSNESCKVIVDYKYWYDNAGDVNNSFVLFPLQFSHNLLKFDVNKWFVSNGRLQENHDQVRMFFKIPDFTSENLEGQLKWVAGTSE